MSRFSSKIQRSANTISVAAMGEKCPLYPWVPGFAVQNKAGESEKASLLPRKAEAECADFFATWSAGSHRAATGESWKPVGAVRKKMLPRSGAEGTNNSELHKASIRSANARGTLKTPVPGF